MRAFVVTGPRRYEIAEVPAPEVGPGEVLVRSRYTAVCGSDLKLLGGELHDAEYPIIPGHEWCGEVVEAPADRSDLVGQLVVGDNFTICGACEPCLEGRPNLCRSLREIGFTESGSFAQLFVVAADRVVVAPPSLTAERAPFVEPLGVALHAADRAGSLLGRSVGILGAGTVGLLLLLLAQAGGAVSATVVEPAAERRALATALGAATAAAAGGAGFDVVFDASGDASAFDDALRLAASGGRVVLVGYSGDATATVRPSTILLSELTVLGSLSGVGTLRKALALIDRGTLDLSRLPVEVVSAADFAADPAPPRPGILRTVVRTDYEDVTASAAAPTPT